MCGSSYPTGVGRTREDATITSCPDGNRYRRPDAAGRRNLVVQCDGRIAPGARFGETARMSAASADVEADEDPTDEKWEIEAASRPRQQDPRPPTTLVAGVCRTARRASTERGGSHVVSRHRARHRCAVETSEGAFLAKVLCVQCPEEEHGESAQNCDSQITLSDRIAVCRRCDGQEPALGCGGGGCHTASCTLNKIDMLASILVQDEWRRPAVACRFVHGALPFMGPRGPNAEVQVD